MVSPRGLRSSELISPPLSSSSSLLALQSPFSGLVICVTGLSKETRKQVKDATERLGGQYSPNLHPSCTHLVVQSFGGRKFEHALKYGSRKGLLIVTIGWFIDSVRGNVRLSESRYNIKNAGGINMHMDGLSSLFGFNGIENSYLPADVNENIKQCDIIKEPNIWLPMERSKSFTRSALSGYSIYVDPDLSPELHSKVVEAAASEGAQFLDQWFVGCSASHVVCEGPAISRYLGHSNNVVTPLWILKTAREKSMHKLVHLSADIARQIGSMLENFKCGFPAEHKVIHEDSCHQDDWNHAKNKKGCEKRQQVVTLAKAGIRGRRARCMQTCHLALWPITPSSLLDSICWSVSEPPSTASAYSMPLSFEDASEYHASVFSKAEGDGKESEVSFLHHSRPLSESEKNELVFKNHFLTILFPLDRLAEMGPSSRTFFSDKGFTLLQILDYIYSFYQENMSLVEVEAAIHIDSRHADRLRSVYSSEEAIGCGHIKFKRIEFLGSRKSFEILRRVGIDHNNNVYELVLRA